METLAVPFAPAGFQVKQDGDSETGLFSGLASTFGNTDLQGDVVEPGAFKDSIKTPSAIRMLWAHDSTSPIGVWEEVRETRRGLEVKGRLILGVQRAKEAFELMRAGAVDALSIGFRVPKGGAVTDKAGIRHLRKVDLMEVSIVVFPANERARVQRVKSLLAEGGVPSRRDMERALTEVGCTRSQMRAFMADGFSGLEGHDPEAESLAAECRKFAADIRAAASQYGPPPSKAEPASTAPARRHKR